MGLKRKADLKTNVEEKIIDNAEYDEEFDEAEEADTKGEHMVKSDDHPGWLWDAEKEEWVPDPNHIGE